MTPNRTDPTAAKRTDPTAVDGSDLLALVQLALGRGAGAGCHADRGGGQHGRRAIGVRAARRSRDDRVPARSRHGCHGLFRHAQGAAGHGGSAPLAALPETGDRRPAASRASRPRTTAPVSPIRTRSRPRFQTWISHTCGISLRGGGRPRAPRAKRPRSASIHGSRTPKVRPLARIVVCAPTAIRTAFSRLPGTLHSVSCAVLGVDGEAMERVTGGTARDWRGSNAESVGRQAGARAVRRLGARKLATTRAPVLFSPDIARGLVGSFVGAIRGGSQYRRTTFLLNAAGQRVFPEWFAISERPHLPKALGSAPFDHEGVRAIASSSRTASSWVTC